MLACEYGAVMYAPGLIGSVQGVYGHLWPDADESTRAAIGEIIAERMAQ
jgi:hypothetical protein